MKMLVQPIGLWKSGPPPPPAPTITSVVGVDANDVTVNYSPPATWNFFKAEVYEDAGLTILNQTIENFTISGSFQFQVSSLNPSTQYWIRMKVSDDGGATYSAWSNIGTGSTSP